MVKARAMGKVAVGHCLIKTSRSCDLAYEVCGGSIEAVAMEGVEVAEDF